VSFFFGGIRTHDSPAFSGVWSADNLDKLRLCRNRAYHKCNVKKRQHLHASLASYLIKEWLVYYPVTEQRNLKENFI
jgi:hypothetical protein